MTVHLSLSGKWVTCNASVRACPREYHLDTSIEEARRAPLPFLDQLLGIKPAEQTVGQDGSTVWHDAEGLMHRDYDLPAYIRGDGSHTEWWSHGKRHRTGDKPAVETSVGYRAWWKNGKLHRVNKPAVIYPNGNEEYWYKGTRGTKNSVRFKLGSRVLPHE
jgi:hypothetical protein